MEAEEVVRAARAEIGFMRHMAACHSAAIGLLEREGDSRHMAERTVRATYLQDARTALGGGRS